MKLHNKVQTAVRHSPAATMSSPRAVQNPAPLRANTRFVDTFAPATVSPRFISGGGGSTNPVVAEARRWQGRTMAELDALHWQNRTPTGDPFLAAFDPSAPNTASCADFVASALIASGLLPKRIPYASAGDYASTEKLVPAMKAAGFSERTGITGAQLKDPEWCRRNLKPGDVIIVNNANFGHALIYTGVDPNTHKPMFIGANNVAEKNGKPSLFGGPQQVTEVSWDAIEHWMGSDLTIAAYSAPR